MANSPYRNRKDSGLSVVKENKVSVQWVTVVTATVGMAGMFSSLAEFGGAIIGFFVASVMLV
jgi:hypothetical protein